MHALRIQADEVMFCGGTLNLREWTMQEWSEVTKAAYKITVLVL